MHDARNEMYAWRMQSSPFVLTEPIPAPETAEDALMSLMMALGRRMRQRQPGDVIDYSAFPLLKLLSHQGPMRVSAMAQVLGLDASTVSRHAKQLEDRGLLERTEDPDDGRASRVTMSEQGNACLKQSFETRRHVISSALEDFSDDERETLRDLLGRLVQTLLNPADPGDAHDSEDSRTHDTQEHSA
jgi:DNA-binding MarR family transcriptional regulator